MNDIAPFVAKNRLSELIRRVEAGEEICHYPPWQSCRTSGAPEAAAQRALDAVAGLRASRRGVSPGST
jgi:hypothetical protein